MEATSALNQYLAEQQQQQQQLAHGEQQLPSPMECAHEEEEEALPRIPRKRPNPETVLRLGRYLFHRGIKDEDYASGDDNIVVLDHDGNMVVGEEYLVPIMPSPNAARHKRTRRPPPSPPPPSPPHPGMRQVTSVPALAELGVVHNQHTDQTTTTTSPLDDPQPPKHRMMGSASVPMLSSMATTEDKKKKKKKKKKKESKHSSCSSSKEETSLFHNSPDHQLESILSSHGMDRTTVPSLELEDFFVETTEEHIAGYEPGLIAAVRANDLDTLRRNYLMEGRTLQCCNRFGESILHMACRRGSVEVVRFLLQEARISVRVRDDYGRTPLHDACWTQKPELELVSILLQACPDLLYLTDKRGFTPLAYVRKQHWSVWCHFLEENRDAVMPRDLLRRFVDGPQ